MKRHFNFSAKASQEMFSVPTTGKIPQSHFDKHNFLSDVRHCLDLCCSYIQALNALCGAGSSLARNLFHIVQTVPAYHNVSQQFASMWEDISKGTASASASVKTETLMMLQEILNSFEMCADETDLNDTITESFQVIGTCLCSFIELQAQFSWNTWKSLSKLSKNFSNDSMRHTHNLQWRSFERGSTKMFMNNHLNSNIKKHFSQLFCKVGLSKVNDSVDTNQSNFYTTASIQNIKSVAVCSPFRPEITVGKDASCVWSSPSALWATSDHSALQFHGSAQPTEKGLSKSNLPSDLDEVINLLSCTPGQQSFTNLNSENQNYIPYSSSSGSMYHLLHKGPGLSHPRALNSHISWSKENKDLNIGHDSWLWRSDNMNCSGLPTNSKALKMSDGNTELQWENKELQKWNSYMYETGSSSDDGSSVLGQDPDTLSCASNFFSQHFFPHLPPRRHNSGESMPGGLENVSEVREENILETRSKISTWPLKQSVFKNVENHSQELDDSLKYTNLHFSPMNEF